MEVEFLQDYGTAKLYWPDSVELNRQLMQEAFEEEKRDPIGMRVTNYGGWHSKWIVQHWNTEAARTLLARIEEAKNLMAQHVPIPERGIELTSVWVNINRNEHYNYPHWHKAYLSGFYCVSDGNPNPTYPDNGVTRLVKGRSRLPWKIMERPDDANIEEYTHPATEGSMLIFPSKLLHYVNPYYGDGARITIAFNFTLEEV